MPDVQPGLSFISSAVGGYAWLPPTCASPNFIRGDSYNRPMSCSGSEIFGQLERNFSLSYGSATSKTESISYSGCTSVQVQLLPGQTATDNPRALHAVLAIEQSVGRWSCILLKHSKARGV
jgi:hypothetical protein